MSFDGRVGQLLTSDGEACGSAWLVSPRHALTAKHCVDPPEPRYTIRFANRVVAVRLVDLQTDVSKGLDLAVLTVDDVPPSSDLTPLVVPITAYLPRRGERVNLLGFPFSAAGEVHTGTHLHGTVSTNEGRVQDILVPVIQLEDVPNTTDELRGISGGIAWLENLGGRDVAVGVVFHGGKHSGVHVVPIAHAASWSPAVRDVLDELGDRPPDRLIIEAVEGDESLVDWNGPIPPDDVDELWKGASPVRSICCRAARADLGSALNFALLRMVAHGPDIPVECAVPDWRVTLDGMYLEADAKITDIPSRRRAKAAGAVFDAEHLAERIHHALDRFMLARLHEDIMRQCNDRHAEPVALHVNLRTRMLEIWEDEWHPQLQGDPALLRTMLLRLSTHVEAEVKPRALAKVGPKLARRVLWQPIVYALALAASGVRIAPAAPDLGNIALGNQAGHITGCQQIERVDLSICLRSSQFWTVWMVILARLEERYSDLLAKSVNMLERKEKLPVLTDAGLPPMLLTGGADFKVALMGGAAQVLDYLRNEQTALGEVVEGWYGKTEAEKWMSRLVF